MSDATRELARRSVGATIRSVARERIAHQVQWVHDDPFLIDPDQDELFERLAGVLGRAITAYASSWRDWQHLMPVTPAVAAALDACEGVDHRLGTYRTDVVWDADRRPWLIEITCRFALNGYLSQAVFDEIACDRWGRGDHRYADYLAGLDVELADVPQVFVLRGTEQRNESRLFIDLFERSGRRVVVLPPEEIEARLPDLVDGVCFSELTHAELLSLGRDTIRALASAGLQNDPRTVLLAHDKAFFAVLGDPDFRAAALTVDEAELLGGVVPPTCAVSQRPDIWREALRDRERWILKPRNLGKSEGVRAGVVTGPAEWRRLLDESYEFDAVLQAWIPQVTRSSSVHGEAHDDFVVGTLLFADGSYHGPGVVRASSHPVTNVVDDRKAVALTRRDSDPA